MAAEVKVCNVCQKGIQASFQCFECDKCMCDECKKFHDVFHEVHILQTTVSEMSFCKNHPKVELQFYCETCNCLICQLCRDEGHDSVFDGHIVCDIENYFTKIKKTFEGYQEIIHAKLQKISEVTDSFISKEATSLNEVMQYVPKLEANFIACKEIALRRKKINSEEDDILSKRLIAVIKHLDKPLSKSENIQELFDIAVNLETQIHIHRRCFLPADIDKRIEDEIGTLDMTMGQLFTFHFKSPSFESNVFFVGGIHWTISATPQTSDLRKGTTLTLNSFIKEEDRQVEFVTTDLVFTFILDDENSLVNNQSKTFSSSSEWRSDTLTCQILHYDISQHAYTSGGNNLEKYCLISKKLNIRITRSVSLILRSRAFNPGTLKT